MSTTVVTDSGNHMKVYVIPKGPLLNISRSAGIQDFAYVNVVLRQVTSNFCTEAGELNEGSYRHCSGHQN